MGFFDGIIDKANQFGNWVGEVGDATGDKLGQFGNWLIEDTPVGGLPVLNKIANDRTTDKALQGQKDAADQAGAYSQQALNQLKELNQPLIDIGTEQLQAIKQGIESGAFSGDTSMFNDYQAYVVPQYQPGGAFQNEPRKNLVTPEAFQYNQTRSTMDAPAGVSLDQFQRAAMPTYQQYQPNEAQPGVQQPGQLPMASQRPDVQAPDQFNYSGQAPTIGDAINPEFSGNRAELSQLQQFQGGDAPGAMQWDQRRAEMITPELFQAGEYAGRDIQTAGNAYNPEQAPGMRNVGQDFNTDTFDAGSAYSPEQAPEMRSIDQSFNTGNFDAGNAPELYRSGDAPDAQYYDPTALQYQRDNFRVEDDPGYQRRYKKAMDAIESSAAAQGMQLSGATLKALQEEAANIASEETQAAYNRFQQDDATNYARFQDQRNAASEASKYQNEDQYRRYLDSVGIKGAEADKAVQQFNIDRQYGSEQNKDAFLREQAQKELGMNLNDADFQRWKETEGQKYTQFSENRQFGADQNRESFLREQAEKDLGMKLNEADFQRWKATDGQKYAQFADQRDWSTAQSNAAAAADWEKYQYNTGLGMEAQNNFYNQQQQNLDRSDSRYNTDFQQQNLLNQQGQDIYRDTRNFNYGASQDLQNAQMQQDQMKQGAFESDRDYAVRLAQIKQQNQLDQYGVQRDAYTDDRNFQYGANQDYQNNLMDYNQMQQQNYNLDRDYGLNVAQQGIQNQRTYEQDLLNQYNLNRDFGANQNQVNFGNTLDLYNLDNQNYQQDIANMMNVNNQNFNQNLAYQNMQDQNFNADRSYAAGQNQQNIDNMMNAYNINNQNYDLDRAFNYGVNQDQEAQNWQQYTYGNDQANQSSQNQYSMLQDAYNRDLANKTNSANMMGSLLNTGAGATANVGNAISDYYGTMGDLSLQKANAGAAAAAAKAGSNNLLGWIGI